MAELAIVPPSLCHPSWWARPARPGFEVCANNLMGESRGIEIAPPGAATRIVLAQGYGGWSPEKAGTFTALVLECDDLAANSRELSGRGVTFTTLSSSQPWGE